MATTPPHNGGYEDEEILTLLILVLEVLKRLFDLLG